MEFGNLMKKHGLLILMMFLNACSFFAGEKHLGKVKSYDAKKDIVTTDSGTYSVGDLNNKWHRKHFIGGAISFTHQDYRASINTHSYCSGTMSDVDLKYLIKDYYYGLKNITRIKQHEFVLDGREAIRAVFSGNMDGMAGMVDVVAIKKNECLFEFYLVGPGENYQDLVADFETFFQGFKFK